MAASVRIEAAALTDPRFGVMGRLLGVSRWDALGRMASVWSWCTERCRHDVPLFFFAGLFDDIDPDRFAAAAVAAELGSWADCPEADSHPLGCRHVRVRGTAGRVEWLSDKRAKAAVAGAARAAGAPRDERGRLLPSAASAGPANAGRGTPAPDQRTLERWTSEDSSGQPATGPAESSAPAPAPAPVLALSDPPVVPQGGPIESGFDLAEGTSPGTKPKRSSRRSEAEATDDERAAIGRVVEKLNERTGRQYSADTAEHARRILRLLRKGYSEMDLRCVIWNQANRWEGKEDLEAYLRPKTLFGAENFADYVVEARAAWARYQRDLEVEKHRRLAGQPPSDLVASLMGAKS